MFDIVAALFVNFRCMIRAVRGTGNFVWQQATLVQGCTSEAQLNMDVNLCRLPDKAGCKSKFLVPLAGLMWHPYPADSTVFQSKQAKDSLQSRKTYV